ncbi:hypothetical protein KO494_06150 [Lacinutrix sp. C3R15]|uniref:hypothetical protein n=1 Tax=Flavobacteriaceae TaxID=49546 RepID=UPI001C09E9F9|nr:MULTISPECIES: hypothetical protein [Flavobacteriaceae]MBU2939118.1 hypothetical protein [Lacinutrix sp. C3R15]MDO6622433.1 hypothetical protein [Oceanihabitans sp. 1_MG-2023]
MKKFLFISFFGFFVNAGFSQVGIGTTTPLSTLDVNGNVSFKVLTLEGGPGGNATRITDGYYINLNVLNGTDIEYILPEANTVPGRTYVLRNISTTTNAVLYAFGGLFYASNSASSSNSTNITFDGNTKTMLFYSDGSNWNYGPFGF